MVARPPETLAVLSHALAIRVAGKTIGAINNWGPAQSLTTTDLFEFGQQTGYGTNSYGVPFEKVPGNVSGQEISVSRWDLYTDLAEDAFRHAGWEYRLDMLTEQLSAFECLEQWAQGNTPDAYSYRYRGCWWSQMSKTYDATGDRTVNVSGTIGYTVKSLERAQPVG